MREKEIEQQDGRPPRPVLFIEMMEERLEAQVTGSPGDEHGDGLCVWYACVDVCPPGG